MKNTDKKLIFLVDDDAVHLKLMEIEFREQTDFEVETYATGELCIQHLENRPTLVILDYHLNGIDPNAMNGISTLQKIRQFDKNIPVIMLSSQDKIEVAVNCMHNKAFDYVIKSETAFLRLQKVIANVLHNQRIEKELNWYMSRM